MEQVAENISFPKEEENVLQLWKKIDAFQTSLKQSKSRPRYTFYDGPPFATGLPHYGHILAGTVKDIVTRYAHMNGYHVERRFGWDTHGLPVEYEIDKKLGVKGPDDVKKMGIETYNQECRSIVMRYAQEWEGLVFRGVKVMPYSTACSTPLSNFETQQNYKDTTDPSDEDPGTSMIAWTTTPWTLPSNLALCVNPNLEYLKIEDKKSGSRYILMEARLEILYKKSEDDKVELPYEVLGRFLGKALEGKTYQPILPYFASMKESRGAFRILCDDYVTTESGTGVVHQAPYFGEDDYRVCLREGIITKDMQIVCPVDDVGKFTAEVTDFQGLHVKEADKEIIKKLKADNRLGIIQ